MMLRQSDQAMMVCDLLNHVSGTRLMLLNVCNAAGYTSSAAGSLNTLREPAR